MSTMGISQLAERTGVPATTLRYYETEGLLPAQRNPAGYRRYDDTAVARLSFIGVAKNLGLSLGEIAELLAVRESGVCADVKADLRPRVAAHLDDTRRRAAELAAFTGLLSHTLAHLDAMPDRAGPCDEQCRAPERVQPAERVEPAAPVVCSLGDDAREERVGEWRRLLDGAQPEPVDGGVRFTLPADRAAAAAALAVEEQRCCPFLEFGLRVDGGSVHLEICAPVDVLGFFGAVAGVAGW